MSTLQQATCLLIESEYEMGNKSYLLKEECELSGVNVVRFSTWSVG